MGNQRGRIVRAVARMRALTHSHKRGGGVTQKSLIKDDKMVRLKMTSSEPQIFTTTATRYGVKTRNEIGTWKGNNRG